MIKKTNLSRLEDHTGYWLRCVSNHVSHAFARKLANENVTVAEWAFLRMLYGQPPLPPHRIAQRMGMTKGAITKLVNRLIFKSLVSRIPNADDKRSQIISLTKKGEEFLPKLAALANQNDRECFAHLSMTDHETLQRILHHLSSKLGVISVPTK